MIRCLLSYFCFIYEVFDLSSPIKSAFQKTHFLAIYEAKWGRFKLKRPNLKVLLGSWSSGCKQIWIRSFKWGTIEFSITIHGKVMGRQISQSLGSFQLKSLCSSGRRFHSISGQNLRACNFACLWPASLYSTSLVRYDSYLFRADSSRS